MVNGQIICDPNFYVVVVVAILIAKIWCFSLTNYKQISELLRWMIMAFDKFIMGHS